MIHQSDRALNKDYLIAYADLIEEDDKFSSSNRQYQIDKFQNKSSS
jgi:hypothetical protein